MTYYLKKLGHQELGSIPTSGGNPKRGRYIYISKDTRVLSFFPPLSTTVKNDSSLLPIIPLYHYTPEKVYCNYIYHYDKFHGSTSTRPRNEYRIYSNNSLEPNSYLFKKDDIVIMKKSEIQYEDNTQVVYYLDLISDRQKALYDKCLNIINNSSLKGFHAILNDPIPEIESKIDSISTTTPSFEIVIDQSVTNKIDNHQTNIADLFNSTSFRDFVLSGYQEKCAITRDVIKYRNFFNLEAAHIKPKSHGGSFLPNNGLALSRDMHWAFDKGFFTLIDDSIYVHPDIESPLLKRLHGQKIFIPENTFFRPSIENIKYHNEHIYGLFLSSGRT